MHAVDGENKETLTENRLYEVISPTAAITKFAQQFYHLSGLFPKERMAGARQNFQGGTGNAIG